MRFLAGVTFAFALGWGGAANAYCSAPSAPGTYQRPEPPDEPHKPYCVNSFSNTHTCADWEIDNYNREVRTYNDELDDYQDEVEEYVRKLQSYVNEAKAYALCEINDLDD